MLLVMPRQALPYIGKLANGLRGSGKKWITKKLTKIQKIKKT
jgi:hypothetical protein